MVERIDPSRIIGLDSDAERERYAEQDFRIRSGLCPNDHGLMDETSYGQRCQTCGFFTNTRAEDRRDA
ncbi:hypothetical protein ASD78_12090 [Lysobacter sp. Root667]|uniref:hypothetical protein n=1 Tax=Lysobacter sp. Root667 TaxID=1736581 RepID=UPI0006F7D5DB|nr:hypothetical protein [Lysobacter sp. Root667]KRA74228.1 hypothetical protein ASD78_12090 [Lysobacter sp. Root667]